MFCSAVLYLHPINPFDSWDLAAVSLLTKSLLHEGTEGLKSGVFNILCYGINSCVLHWLHFTSAINDGLNSTLDFTDIQQCIVSSRICWNVSNEHLKPASNLSAEHDTWNWIVQMYRATRVGLLVLDDRKVLGQALGWHLGMFSPQVVSRRNSQHWIWCFWTTLTEILYNKMLRTSLACKPPGATMTFLWQVRVSEECSKQWHDIITGLIRNRWGKLETRK